MLISISGRARLFQLRFWYFVYGQDNGALTAYVEDTVAWSSSSRYTRNWQYQQIERKAIETSTVSNPQKNVFNTTARHFKISSICCREIFFTFRTKVFRAEKECEVHISFSVVKKDL